MKPRKFGITALVVFTGTLAWAEAPKTHEQRVEATRARLSAAEQNVTNSNKNLSCSGDGECEVLEMGERLCGGPDKYIIVSLANTSLSKVKAALIEVLSVEKELNSLDPPMGCSPAPASPESKCEKELCVERTKVAAPHL